MKQLLTHDADLHKIDFYGMDRRYGNVSYHRPNVVSGRTGSTKLAEELESILYE